MQEQGDRSQGPGTQEGAEGNPFLTPGSGLLIFIGLKTILN